MKPPTEDKMIQSNSSHCFIKPSQSMTSLPPPTNTGGSSDNGIELLHTKLRIDRPYNSLKKKRGSERDIWRRSWESGHSHSSCSLQSSTTNNGSGTGKDDFWAALQTNYNYIMDTNLLDSCREARGELEGCVVPELKVTDAEGKSPGQSSKSHGNYDLRTLRRWLREMENRIDKSPTLSEAMKMKTGEIQKRLGEHSELYREIVSQARIVGACIRSSEEIQLQNKSSTDDKDTTAQQQPTSSTANHRRNEASTLKGLEHRYHLLYLKAIEVQCLLEGLLSRKNSPSPVFRSSDTDDEPVAKLARLSDTDFIENQSNNCTNKDCIVKKNTNNVDILSSESDDDCVWDTNFLGLHPLIETSRSSQPADFDADSEGSDCEIVPIVNSTGSVASGSPLAPLSPPICDQTMMETEPTSNNENSPLDVSITTTASHSTNNTTTTTASLSFSPQIIDTVKKRPKQIDPSKFNRSNRKSKNCAIFYFKHLDTDSEQRGDTVDGLSSQTSEGDFRSENPSSEDEWYYRNENANKIQQSLNFFSPDDDDDDEDDEVNIDEDILNGNSSIMGHIKNNDLNENIEDVVEESINANIATKQPVMKSQLLESIDIPDCGDMNGRSQNGGTHDQCVPIDIRDLNNGNCERITPASTYKSVMTYSKESIQQLVLGAETLVREEVILKSKTNSSSSKSRKTFSNHLLILPSSTSSMTTSTPNASTTLYAHATSTTALAINGNQLTVKGDKMSNPKIKRVQEWLEHQPLQDDQNQGSSAPTTDCDASGEYTTESDAHESDTSEGMADSVATCLQGAGTNSQATSTEVIGAGSSEPLLDVVTANNQNTDGDAITPIENIKVILRTANRRNSDRPWSVSCISQLKHTTNVSKSDQQVNNQGLANFSISESALHNLSKTTDAVNVVGTPHQSSTIKSSGSKNSLKKRRAKMRRRAGERRSESGSDGQNAELVNSVNKVLVKSESFSGESNLAQDLSKTLSQLVLTNGKNRVSDSEEDNGLLKPNFCLGAYTTVLVPGAVPNLGSLAALSNYNHDEKTEADQNQTGTEEHSSFSEQAWDNYQEKYNSENYSEGFDSDAARRLMEFGDDYRNFLDSQSDCCSSSLSAANNLDSMSPPRNRKFIQNTLGVNKSPSDGVHTSSSVENSLRRRRGLEHADTEKKRKSSNGNRKMSSDERRRSYGESSNSNNRHSPTTSLRRHSSRNSGDFTDHHQQQGRKLDFDHLTPIQHQQALVAGNSGSGGKINGRRKLSENGGSESRKHRHHGDDDTFRRRSVRSIDKAYKNFSSSSSSDSEDDIEVQNLLGQSRNRLENTEALRIRRHLLRPEDYAEIIATCRDNVRCLESVLRGPPGTVLTPIRCQETRELLSSWESLLNWSENASVARQLQEEMTILKNKLNRLGTDETFGFDTEEGIEYAIEELKKQKLQLNTHRSTMLHLNASVHSWLTRQEMKITKIMETTVCEIDSAGNEKTFVERGEQAELNYCDNELHKYLKDEVGDMYAAWDDADLRISNRLETLTTSLHAWHEFESGLTEFQETLGKDKGALRGLKGALDRGKSSNSDLANDVKIKVANLISGKMENSIQTQLQNSETLHLHPNGIPFNLISSSNGSLSDSGISDGGCVSDGGLSEREKRLGALRRLARQLENALAPGSEALKSISQRMEAAEAELRSLQDTCRELIERTTGQQQALHTMDESYVKPINNSNNSSNSNSTVPTILVPNGKGKMKRSPQSKRNTNGTVNVIAKDGVRRRSSGSSTTKSSVGKSTASGSGQIVRGQRVAPSSDPDPDDPKGVVGTTSGDDDGEKSHWMRRVVRLALPVQLAILTLFCAACLLEPNCCDSLNNFSMSFTPQLRYVRGPPPI